MLISVGCITPALQGRAGSVLDLNLFLWQCVDVPSVRCCGFIMHACQAVCCRRLCVYSCSGGEKGAPGGGGGGELRCGLIMMLVKGASSLWEGPQGPHHSSPVPPQPVCQKMPQAPPHVPLTQTALRAAASQYMQGHLHSEAAAAQRSQALPLNQRPGMKLF